MSDPCYATVHSDQMICHKCGLVWDISDPEPPECCRKELTCKRTSSKQQKVVKATESLGANYDR